MAPLLEFEPFSVDRARSLIAWTEGQKTNDRVEHVDRGNDVHVIFYKDKRREPTIIHNKVRQSFEKWGGHRIYGKQEVLDEIQESIGERGVIFEKGMVPLTSNSLSSEGEWVPVTDLLKQP